MTLVPVSYFSAGQFAFTSTYGGTTVVGLVGSSVNFTWSFSSDVNRVDWGLKEDGVNDFEKNELLVSVSESGPLSVTVPAAYDGRVSGSGNASSGQVIFTLSSIRKTDERFFGCRITNIIFEQEFDSVYLQVTGEYAFFTENTSCDSRWSKVVAFSLAQQGEWGLEGGSATGRWWGKGSRHVR